MSHFNHQNMGRLVILIVALATSWVSNAQTVVYNDDYEVDFEGWSNTNWTRDTDAALGASDGNYLHPTSFDNYGTNVNVTTTSTTIDLTGYYSLVLTVDVSYNTDNTNSFGGLGELIDYKDGMNIEYFDGVSWNLLGSTTEGINWYNDDVEALGTDGWDGDNGGWETAYFVLPTSLENNANVQFRVNFRSGNGALEQVDVGAGFDNFTITSYSSNSGSPGGIATGLSLWLKANGRAIADNSELGIWADESGNDNHAYELTSADRPSTGTQNINGNPVILFDNSHIEGSAGLYTQEIFIVLDPDFISSSSAETGDVLGYQPGDVGSLELGSSTVQLNNELITHTIDPNPGYRAAYTDATGEIVLANPMILNDRSNDTNDGQNIYLNGDPVDNEHDETGSHEFFSDGPYILGFGFDLTDDFQGSIAELISYDHRLSDSDHRDVMTYLGLKYGITLDEDPASSTVNYDYQINGGTTIWPGSSNADYQSYHYDVAGIGQDLSGQELDIASAQSVNDATIVRMKDANDADDEEFIIWGNNNSANSFTTSNVMSGITERLERIWKVKKTGDLGSVTIEFDITNLAVDKDNTTLNLLIAPSSASIPADLSDNETTSLITGGVITSSGGQDILAFSNVSLSDGDFFTLGGDVQTISPGGISSGLTLWLRPDEGLETDNGLVTSWRDVSGSGNDVDQGDSNEKPSVVSKEINSNDAIDFSDDFLDGIAGFNTQEFFMIVKPDAAVSGGSSNGFLLGLQNGSYAGMYLGLQGSDTLIGYAVDDYRRAYVDGVATLDNPVLMLNGRNNGGGTEEEILLDGESVHGTSSGTFANRTNSFFRLGDNFINTNGFDGKISEVISFNARLSDADHRDVETYLAIKYGIGLDISSEGYTVGGSTIFDNNGYTNDIAGIGINLDHGLSQTISQSSNTGSIMRLEAGAGFQSGDYEVWGNDGSDKTSVQSTETPTGYQERLTTEWQIDVTGSPDGVTVKVYLNAITDFSLRPKAASLYALLINSSSDFSTITSAVQGTSFSGDTIIFDNVTFTDNDYFTVAVPPLPSGGIGLSNATLWLDADKGVSVVSNEVVQWDNQVSGAGLGSLQDVDVAAPNYTTVQDYNIVDFDGASYLESPSSISGTTLFGASDNTIIAVILPNSGSNLLFWETASTNRAAFGLNGNNASMAFGDEASNRATGSTNIVSPASFQIITYLTSSGSGNAIYINGGSSDGTSTAGSIGAGSAAVAIGAEPGGGAAINTDLAELGIWSVALSANYRRDVESYYALKYGIELDITSSGYTYNNGTSLYNRTGYGSNIRGIGANNDQSLYLATSKSINGSDIVTIQSPSSLNNLDYLVFGDDGSGLTYTSAGVPTAVNERVGRKWGIDEENDIGTVTITFDLSSEDNTGYDVGDFALIVDSNDDFTDGILSLIAANDFTSEVVTIENVDFSGATHFGLATSRDLSTDTDNDGIPDYFELAYGTDHGDGNSPVSGGSGTPPTDSNNNTGPTETTSTLAQGRISDALEQILIDNGTSSPVSRLTDTDDDGIPDWREVVNGTDPYNENLPDNNGDEDSDNDGLSDSLEALIASEGGAADADPGTDTDGDGIPDYYEVMNGSDPGDANDPLSGGGSANDSNDATGSEEGSTPIISDALESILIAGGATAPIERYTDTDEDGIPDYVEVLSNSDPFDSNSPSTPTSYANIRTLQADYEASGANCTNVDGYQWLHITDNLGNLVFSINPLGNDLGSTCWAVRVLDGEPNVRSQSSGNQDDFILNRNWWINPTTQPSGNPVYLRFYAAASESTDLRQRAINEGYDPDVISDFVKDSINITKIGGIDDLDPFVSGGSRTLISPTGSDFRGTDHMFTCGVSSFSSFVPYYAPNNSSAPLPIELAYFRAQARENGVWMTWKTLTEINNDSFTIQYSANGSDFYDLINLKGAGNSNEPIVYSYLDDRVVHQTTYYRLVQNDFDGKSTIYDAIVVHPHNQLLIQPYLFPNPVQSLAKVQLPGNTIIIENGIEIFDLTGKAQRVNSIHEEDFIHLDFGLLNAGQYIIKIRTLTDTYTLPILKQ